MSASTPNKLVAIIGATGTGKSALAVALAHRFNGEIVNADAMQMYRGLPIITNKISAAEREGVPHHLLDFIALDAPTWTVKQFVAAAKQHIDDIRGRGRLPIVVGGTGYYVHGLLTKGALLGEAGEEEEHNHHHHHQGVGVSLGEMTVEEMYARLQELDPEIARTWHPRDKRRIERSLEICLTTGRKASELYKEQQAAKEELVDANGGSDGGGEGALGLQQDALLLWLEAEDDVLKQRLDSRVDAMVQNGLFDEVLQLYEEEQRLLRENVSIDKSKGIWQSIGYKELEQWARETTTTTASTAGSKSTVAANGIQGVKAGTRQYAKRQNRYIRNRFASSLTEAGALDRLFLIDSTDISLWSETAVPQSEELVSAFLDGRQLPDAATLSDLARSTLARITKHADWRLSRVAHYCDTCRKTLMGEQEWQRHLTSRSHKNVVLGQHKRAVRDEYLASVKRAATGAEEAHNRPS